MVMYASMPQLQNPNYVGNALGAYSQGENMGLKDQAIQEQPQLNALASQSYGMTDPTQQTNLLQQMAQISPQAAQAQQQQFGQMNAQQHAAAQQRMMGVAQAATAIGSIQDPTQKQQAWNQFLQQEQQGGANVSSLMGMPADLGIKMAQMQVANVQQMLDSTKPVKGEQQQWVTGFPVRPGVVADGWVNPATHQFTPATAAPNAPGAQGAPGSAAGTPTAATGFLGTLPAETQAYVPSVLGKLGNQPMFNPDGTPTAAALNAVMQQESGGNPNAVSSAGAQGAYQLMPATAASVGVNNPMDPVQARAGAAKYLQQLGQQFGQDPSKVLAAYNAGPGKVTAALNPQPTLGFGESAAKSPAGDEFAKNKAFADQLQAAGMLPTPQAYQQVVMTGKAPAPSDAGGALSSSQETLAQGLANYRLEPSAYGLSKPAMQDVMARVMQINPDYNAASYKGAQKLYTDMASTSPTSIGGQLTAAGAALGHLSEMAKISTNLPNHLGLVNAAENGISSALNTGDASSLTDWNNAKNFVAGELSKFVKGGVASEGETDAMLQNLSYNNPNRNDALATAANFLVQKEQALEQHRDQVLGSASPGTSLLSPDQQEMAKQLVGMSKNYTIPQFRAYGTHALVNTVPAASGAPGGTTQPSQAGAPNIDALLAKYGAH